VSGIDREVVRHVARLARLTVDPDEEELLVDEMRRIVEFVDVLAGLPESVGDHGDPGPVAPLREDRPHHDPHGEALLTGAPDRDGDLLRVPAVLSES